MMDQGFPGQHTTTTTVTTSTTTTQPNIRFDPSYARTLPGILKIVQVVSPCISFSRKKFLNKLNKRIHTRRVSIFYIILEGGPLASASNIISIQYSDKIIIKVKIYTDQFERYYKKFR